MYTGLLAHCGAALPEQPFLRWACCCAVRRRAGCHREIAGACGQAGVSVVYNQFESGTTLDFINFYLGNVTIVKTHQKILLIVINVIHIYCCCVA